MCWPRLPSTHGLRWCSTGRTDDTLVRDLFGVRSVPGGNPHRAPFPGPTSTRPPARRALSGAQDGVTALMRKDPATGHLCANLSRIPTADFAKNTRKIKDSLSVIQHLARAMALRRAAAARRGGGEAQSPAVVGTLRPLVENAKVDRSSAGPRRGGAALMRRLGLSLPRGDGWGIGALWGGGGGVALGVVVGGGAGLPLQGAGPSGSTFICCQPPTAFRPV